MIRSLRTRLLVALVGLSIGVLVTTALVAALIARANARQSATEELRAETVRIAAAFDELFTQRRSLLQDLPERRRTDPTGVQQDLRDLRAQLSGLREALAVIDAGAFWLRANGTVGTMSQLVEELQRRFKVILDQDPDGAAEQTLPPGVEVFDLDLDRLAAGHTVSGEAGSRAYVAQAVSVGGLGHIVVVLTKSIDTRPFGRFSGIILLAAAGALAVALVIAYALARRLTRPLRAIETAAAKIADGDLRTRVELRGRADDELVSLARTLDAMATQLEQAKGLERAFLLSVSHDLRTPLTSIRGYAEAIADGTIDAPEDRHRAAAVIGSEARRLERLVADLLDLARLDAREFSLTPRPVDAAGVVREAVDAFRPAAAELDLALESETPPRLLVDADPERLGQIVANLVENALKYATTTVRVTLVADDPTMTLRVDDDGPGIPVEELPRVFERLYTGRGTPSRRVGTGIGLAIVRQLAGAMGGTAIAQPLTTGGTRFSVQLPRGVRRDELQTV